MTLAVVLFAVGLALSAFFSGTETGFYRATRARLLIDALGGDRISRALLWTTIHPSIFITTTLVGNNLANNIVSLAAVMGASHFWPGSNPWTGIIAPALLSPLVFIYGELFPKQLFLEAPNRMLRRSGPLFLVAGILFAPVTFLIWIFDRLVRLIAARSPQEIRFTLARRELEDVLELGHEAGILYPSQQALVQACLNSGGQPIRNFVTAPARAGHATTDMSKDDMIRLAKRLHRSLVPVEQANGNQVVGFVRLTELVLSDRTAPPKIHPCVVAREHDSFLVVLAKLIGEHDSLAQVVAEKGQTIGYVSGRELQNALWAA